LNDNVVSLFADQDGKVWVGQYGGVSRFDPATERFTNYPLAQDESAGLAYTVSALYRDRSGTLWLGTWGGVLSRFDEKTNSWLSYEPDQHDSHRLQGGSIGAIHEDAAGKLWVGCGTGLYFYDRQRGSFTRYTENQGLASNDVQGILEDRAGRLWLSTKAGISRFDPSTGSFRNYDVSDGLLSNNFSRSCQARRENGEMLFCGTNGVTTFFPERVRDNSFVPPVVITSFRIFNKPVPVGPGSVLKKAIPYVDSLVLSYKETVFSFEFAALSYANAQKNHYRYKLQGFDPGWNEVGSNQRLATYTNLNPGKYVFRVQGSNSDWVWNEEGVSLPIVISPPLWKTSWFRVLCAVTLLGLLWGAYQLRLRQLEHQLGLTLEARVGERTRIARDLHDTLLQSFHGVLLRLQTVSYLLRERPGEAQEALDSTIEQVAEAIKEGRNAVQGLRSSTVEGNDLALAIRTIGEALVTGSSNHRPAFHIVVEGESRALHPIVRDEIYKIAVEALRNAFRYARAQQIEAEIRYDNDQFRLRIRDDGKGIEPAVLAGTTEGHYGLPGMRERATLIGGKLVVWSDVDAGTEIELCVPSGSAYATNRRSHGSRETLPEKGGMK
jgi:signal transduction histidine kinase